MIAGLELEGGMAGELWRMSAVDIAAAIRGGDISCVEAVTAAVDRMATVNGSVNAVVNDLSETALEQARRADEVVRSGVELGPLHGVPVTIKENADQRGLPTPNGLPALAEVLSPDDSPVVTNLLKAGAIVIGRTNTPEFSLRWFSDNPLHGKTLNPWKAEITPGGSTGGGAAAVALGIGAIAHGSDLGGSLRYPAYACGLATIRPSLGRIPAYNPSGAEERPPTFQLMSVQGPIAREVRDVRLAMAAMARGDTRDPWWVPAPIEGPRIDGPLRVAVTKTPVGLTCHPAVAAAVDQAADYLRAAGYAVEEVDPPLVDEVAASWRAILMTDTKVMMEEVIRKFGSADINAVYDGFQASVPEHDLAAYMRAVADRTRLIRAWNLFLEDYPLILAPVCQVPPYPQGEDLKGNDRMREILDEQTLLYAVNLLGLPAAAVPTGLHDSAPMGVQIIGQRFREDLCLDAAQVIETATGVLTDRLLDGGDGDQ
jgi:amidase